MCRTIIGDGAAENINRYYRSDPPPPLIYNGFD